MSIFYVNRGEIHYVNRVTSEFYFTIIYAWIELLMATVQWTL